MTGVTGELPGPGRQGSTTTAGGAPAPTATAASGDGAAPEISVILLTKNAGDGFGAVLDALFACRSIDRAEVVLIDSGSTDGTLETARSFPVSIHTIPPEEFGHGRTRNLGASLARGKVLVFLVQDAEPADEGFLDSLLGPLARDPQLAATYARQVPRPDASPVEAELVRHTYPPRPSVRRLEGKGDRPTIGAVFFSNVASAIRRDLWRRFPFDETLIMSEDQEWAGRVLRAGHRIAYCPDAVVVHSHGYPLSKVLRRNFDSGHSLVGIVHDRPAGMVAYELRFLGAATAGLVRRGRPLWIVWLLFHETARATGFFLGRHAGLLPARWRRALSLHRSYWDKR